VTALVVGVVVSSLLGSLHCAGMCGPLVAIYAAGPSREAPLARRLLAHASYSLGRLSAYAVLGALSGAAGATLDRAGALAGVARTAAIVSGSLIVIWGAAALLAARGVRVGRLEAPAPMKRALAAVMRAVAPRPPAVRAVILGIASGLLPCGWLWAFVVTAAGTGSPYGGALVMAAFWAGTLPVMLAVGETVRAAAGPLARHVPAACAVLLVVLGLWTVVGRAGAAPPSTAPACHVSR
jgi:sulfite exporter TauE/SafE